MNLLRLWFEKSFQSSHEQSATAVKENNTERYTTVFPDYELTDCLSCKLLF